MIKGFRTYDLAVELYEKCEHIRAKRHVKDQLSRASLNVVLNLAEGSGKPTQNEQRRYYSIAMGSLRETQALLQITKSETHYKLAHQLDGSLYRLIHSR